jgi:hypothetical protein
MVVTIPAAQNPFGGFSPIIFLVFFMCPHPELRDDGTVAFSNGTQPFTIRSGSPYYSGTTA